MATMGRILAGRVGAGLLVLACASAGAFAQTGGAVASAREGHTATAPRAPRTHLHRAGAFKHADGARAAVHSTPHAVRHVVAHRPRPSLRTRLKGTLHRASSAGHHAVAKASRAVSRIAHRVTRALHRKPDTRRVSYHAADEGAPNLALDLPPLPYSEEFERAELVDRMLTECRGIAYNALELAQSTGEALHRPAPIQLLVIRVRHPWCADLLRAYARRIDA